jgi:two-component system, cell cycle response regulator DivK
MPEQTRRALVLLVDDFEDNREMFADYLVFAGFEVAQAGTGTEALEKAFALLPDIILMDLSLPGLDGWEATRRLKQDERTRAIPVIAVTGHALRGHSEGAMQAGCDAFIAKPCMPEDLVRKMGEFLPARSKTGS